MSAGLSRPLGLVLAGGGALGAWQAGALKRLSEELAFDHVLGISIGAVNGAAYAGGLLDELLAHWGAVELRRPLRFSLRLKPWLTLFSDAPLRELLRKAQDDDDTRERFRCRLSVVSLCVEDGLPLFAEFLPRGRGGWDAPLMEHLVASCAIPRVFPPVILNRGQDSLTLVDGGVPGRAPMSFELLAGCKDLLVLEMARNDEPPPASWRPFARLDYAARQTMKRMLSQGMDSLRHVERPPRLFHLMPSRRLAFTMLDFKDRYCRPALELGRADAEAFLKDPSACRA